MDFYGSTATCSNALLLLAVDTQLILRLSQAKDWTTNQVFRRRAFSGVFQSITQLFLMKTVDLVI